MAGSTGQRVAARVAATLGALWWGIVFYGLIDLLVVPTQDETFHEHYLLETGWGLLFLFLVATPLVGLAFRPGSWALTGQVAVVGVAIAAVAVVTGYPRQLEVAAGVLGTAVLVALLGGGGRPRPVRPSPALGGLALVAVPVCVGYTSTMLRGWRDVRPDTTIIYDHRPMQAALGLAVLLVAVLLAVVPARTSGRRLSVWTLTGTVAWLGVVSAAYPSLVGSLGRPGGLLSVGWAVLVVVAAEVGRRRGPAVIDR